MIPLFFAYWGALAVDAFLRSLPRDDAAARRLREIERYGRPRDSIGHRTGKIPPGYVVRWPGDERRFR